MRSLEHLDFTRDKPESKVKSHIKSCDSCKQCNFENFEFKKKCKSDRDTKIHEAIFIKQEWPKLNISHFNKGSFVTLDIFYWCLSCVVGLQRDWIAIRLTWGGSRGLDSWFISSQCISLFTMCVIVGSGQRKWSNAKKCWLRPFAGLKMADRESGPGLRTRYMTLYW